MKPTGGTWMSSKDAAVKLKVHVRTLRNWIDTFSPYMLLQKNSQGHYLLSEQAYNLLIEIKRVKDSGIQTLKEIEDVLLYEQILPERKSLQSNELPQEETQSPPLSGDILESISRIETQINKRIFEAFSEISSAYESHLPPLQGDPRLHEDQLFQQEMLKKINEIEKKQEGLKLELRKINFEIQLMNAIQKDTKKKGFFHFLRWPFTSKEKAVSEPAPNN